MIRLNYSFATKTPIFTGSDENNGTTRSLRREKRLLPTRVTLQSKFKCRKSRQTAALNVLFAVYKQIDNSLKSANYGFYDSFANKAKASTQCQDKYAFLNQLCESCGVESISDKYADCVRETIDLFEDNELLETIRSEHQFLILRLREAVKVQPEYTPSVSDLTGDSAFSFTKSFDKIPYIGGNSVRGLMRRLLMYDYVQQLGIVSMEKEMYHRLFTGGTLSDSSGVEDMVLRRGLTELCPPIALLGSAIGSQTIEGALKVTGARLRCLENGTGDVSFWELIETQFGTRLDSSKQESKLDLIGNEKPKSGKGKDVSTQMKFQNEVFITGSVFDSAFVIDTHSPIVESCFYRAVELFRNFGFVGGNSARDSGNIDMKINIPDDGSKLYLDYLQSIKEKAFNHFQKQMPQ
jgi:hypothetical protein